MSLKKSFPTSVDRDLPILFTKSHRVLLSVFTNVIHLELIVCIWCDVKMKFHSIHKDKHFFPAYLLNSSFFSHRWDIHPLPFVNVYGLLTSSLLQVLRLVIVKWSGGSDGWGLESLDRQLFPSGVLEWTNGGIFRKLRLSSKTRSTN